MTLPGPEARDHPASILLGRDLRTGGVGARFRSADEAIRHYYDHPSDPNCCGDEFVQPSLIVGTDSSVARIVDGDSVIFFNYRGDRPRELCKAFTSNEFPFPGGGDDKQMLGFDRGTKLDLNFVTMTAYETGLPVFVAFEKVTAS